VVSRYDSYVKTCSLVVKLILNEELLCFPLQNLTNGIENLCLLHFGESGIAVFNKTFKLTHACRSMVN
jgi:hypothetical protein